MPLTLNVGVTKKIGLPNFSSAGASCSLETEVDGSLIFADLSEFQQQVQQAFDACRRAVTDELANHCGHMNGEVEVVQLNGAVDGAVENGHPVNNPPPATERQVNYARDLASQIPGLGVERLDSVAAKMFEKTLAELTSPEASKLIDVLRDIRSGSPRAYDILNGEGVQSSPS